WTKPSQLNLSLHGLVESSRQNHWSCHGDVPARFPSSVLAVNRRTNSLREMVIAPSERVWSFPTWQSITRNPHRRSWPHRCTSAIFDASVTRLNIDSP